MPKSRISRFGAEPSSFPPPLRPRGPGNRSRSGSAARGRSWRGSAGTCPHERPRHGGRPWIVGGNGPSEERPALPRHERPRAALPERLRLPGPLGRSEVEKSLGLGHKREIRGFRHREFRARLQRARASPSPRARPSNPSAWAIGATGTTRAAAGLRDGLQDGGPRAHRTLPSGLTVTARASEIVRNLGSIAYGGSYFTFSDENNYTIGPSSRSVTARASSIAGTT